MDVGLLTGPMGMAYGWSTGDWRTVARAHETGAVLAAGVWAAPGIAAMPWYGNIGASMALSYTSGYTIAQIYGASNGQASAAGRKGARYAGIVSLLYMGTMEMRELMVEQSKLNPDNATGVSAGYGGDGFKLGGCRYSCSQPDLFGGIQCGFRSKPAPNSGACWQGHKSQ